jgi:hypothetical protein
VVCDADGRLEVPDQALQLLHTVANEPVAVVSVAGPSRSGKSFLLNCLAAPDVWLGAEQPLEGGLRMPGQPQPMPLPRIFAVGPAVQPCTRGLWVWVDPLPTELPDGTKLRIVYVDTEGVGAVKASEQKDMYILVLALLVSSTFVFNTVGAIDENAVAKLAFVTRLSRHVRIQEDSNDSADDFERFFPQFLWVLRDFSLQLRGSSGDPLAAKQYLER